MSIPWTKARHEKYEYFEDLGYPEIDELLAAHRRAMELLVTVSCADSTELLAGSDVYLRNAEIEAIRRFVVEWRGEPDAR